MTAIKDINLDQLIDDVRRHAQELPDTHAPCQYFYSNTNPCCVVGHGLHDQGVTKTDIKRALDANGSKLPDPNQTSIEAVLSGASADEDALKLMWLTAIQEAQDRGYTWGEALTAADSQVEL